MKTKCHCWYSKEQERVAGAIVYDINGKETLM